MCGDWIEPSVCTRQKVHPRKEGAAPCAGSRWGHPTLLPMAQDGTPLLTNRGEEPCHSSLNRTARACAHILQTGLLQDTQRPSVLSRSPSTQKDRDTATTRKTVRFRTGK